MDFIDSLRQQWEGDGILLPSPVNNDLVTRFEQEHMVVLPDDLKSFYNEINGSGDKYDSKMFRFYSLNTVNTVVEEFTDWKGVPNYQLVLENLSNADKYYVFADYFMHSFSYAVKLTTGISAGNEVIAICGGEYRTIATSFTRFIELYFADAEELQLA